MRLLRHLLLLLLAVTAAGSAATAQPAPDTRTLTLPTALRDSDGDGIIVLSSNRAPFRRGERLTQCAHLPNFTYAVVCPTPPAPQPTGPTPVVINAPRITTPFVAGNGNSRAPRRQDLHMGRAMEAWTFLDRNGYDNVVISDVRIDLARAGVYNAWNPDWPTGSTLDWGSIRGLTVERVEATCAKYCVNVGRNTGPVLIQDVRFIGGTPSTTSSIPTGIQVVDGAHDVVINRFYIAGFLTNWAANKYANGDGITANRTRNIRITNGTVEGNSDGGIDIKTANAYLDNVTASNNGHYGFRFWGNPVTAGTLICRNNAWSCIDAEANSHVVIDHLIAVGGEELVTAISPTAYVEIRSCDLTGWTGTAPTRGRATFVLGPTCRRN